MREADVSEESSQWLYLRGADQCAAPEVSFGGGVAPGDLSRSPPTPTIRCFGCDVGLVQCL